MPLSVAAGRDLPRVVLAAALALIAIVPAAARGQARTMSWPALDVKARLDASGALHVTERQTIRFDGPWNGGERVFRVPSGQRLRFERISRETDDGRLVELVRGDLGRVDHYDFTERHTLRWRSRAPDDPPFAAATLTYVLEYTLSGVLAREGDGRYLLHHDFAFPDRAWPIHEARASLDLDPAWQAGMVGPLHLEAAPLAPGKSLVARVPLRWAGTGAGPALPGEGLAYPWRAVLAGALAAILAAAGVMLVRHARARGQLAPLPAQVDDAFLREHVLSRSPEVIGAAYDDAVGAPEVAAVLARLSAEGKLEARVVKGRRFLGLVLGRDVVRLALRAERGAFTGHERSLVDALFVDGDTIDTDRLKAHYGDEGFDPADGIRSTLERAVRALAPRGAPVVGLVPWCAAAVLLVVGVLLAIPGGDGPPVVLSIHGVVLPLVAVVAVSARLRRSATGVVRKGLALLAVLAAWAGGVLWLAAGGFHADGWWIAAHVCFWAAGIVVAAALARTPLGPEEMALRKRLAAARAHLERELARERPRLDDTWLPYLLALGLGPDVDRWFGAYGGARTTWASDPVTYGGSGVAGGGPRWTGGGGAFSGGGATGTWAAFGAIAASIPAPSSGSGSDSGGGSSSGGGGGGGW